MGLSAFWIFRVGASPQPQVLGWIVAGKRQKFFVEVGQIVVAGPDRDPRPLDGPDGVSHAEGVLKSVELRQFFHRNADQSFEVCDEVVLADADGVTEVPDRYFAMLASHLGYAITHDRQSRRRFSQSVQQQSF